MLDILLILYINYHSIVKAIKIYRIKFTCSKCIHGISSKGLTRQYTQPTSILVKNKIYQKIL